MCYRQLKTPTWSIILKVPKIILIEAVPGMTSFLLDCFVALRPNSTAMVMVGRSVHLTTLFPPGKLEQAVNQYFVHILSLVADNNYSKIIQRRGGG